MDYIPVYGGLGNNQHISNHATVDPEDLRVGDVVDGIDDIDLLLLDLDHLEVLDKTKLVNKD